MNITIGMSNAWIRQGTHEVAWLWDGVVALGAITLLSAPEKTGKSTLLSLLLDRRRAGGELLGRAVDQGRSIVCTEESTQIWRLRQPPLDFGNGVVFTAPDSRLPTTDGWKRFIKDVVELRLANEDDPYELLVIDTAISFLPLSNRSALADALGELKTLLGFPLAVLVINQSRNYHRPLAAFADIVIEMSKPRNASERRRVFDGVGRYPGTLQKAVADLDAEGTAYDLVTEDACPAPPSLLDTVLALLLASAAPRTRRELLATWPGAPPRPDSLWRALDRGVELGLLTMSGKGTKTKPFRYAVKEVNDQLQGGVVTEPVPEPPDNRFSNSAGAKTGIGE